MERPITIEVARKRLAVLRARLNERWAWMIDLFDRHFTRCVDEGRDLGEALVVLDNTRLLLSLRSDYREYKATLIDLCIVATLNEIAHDLPRPMVVETLRVEK